jgi:sporadic carbohydrate cluster 2OG-Fe(II) oxygenase
MGLTESFYAQEEEALGRDFLENGYVIRAVDDRDALDALRREVAKLVAAHLERDPPNDIDGFLDGIHKIVPVARLNDLRLSVYRSVNALSWFRPTYFALGRKAIETLVGNELAMQNRVNLSIQMPDDDSSLLDIHADVFGGETPFQVVEWLPLVDCHDTKSMFILPAEQTRHMVERMTDFAEGGMAQLFDAVKDDLVWLDVPYGTALIFSPNCLHGNVVNRVGETRWSMNCRFTGLFTPYTGHEKKIGSYYLPITTRAVSRVGMSYRYPQGFKE